MKIKPLQLKAQFSVLYNEITVLGAAVANYIQAVKNNKISNLVPRALRDARRMGASHAEGPGDEVVRFP